MDLVDELLQDFIEIEALDVDQFLQVRETLTRIGLCKVNEAGSKVLWQSCYLLQKRQRYFIVHFKELYMLDGKPDDMTEEDLDRVEYVAALLQEWGLIKCMCQVQKTKVNLVIVPHSEKSKWKLRSKYNFGANK